MKDIVIAICFIIVVASWSLTGCAHKNNSRERTRAISAESFEKTAPAEKSTRALDKDDKY